VFDDFCHANDPHEEHDFGSFEAEGHTIFFKIDYFDRNLKYHSPDPTDPAVTVRVITVKREMDLTIQKQVQAALGAVRDQAKQEGRRRLGRLRGLIEFFPGYDAFTVQVT
jgi:Protein of unknown function (DUF3768)